jgi:hypothetical protein
LDTKLRKAVNYIFQDYYSQGSGWYEISETSYLGWYKHRKNA